MAIAGTRVAWITRTGRQLEETNGDLYTASLKRGRYEELAHAFRVQEFGPGGVQLWGGDWIGGLVGSGKLLVVSRWRPSRTPAARP